MKRLCPKCNDEFWQMIREGHCNLMRCNNCGLKETRQERFTLLGWEKVQYQYRLKYKNRILNKE